MNNNIGWQFDNSYARLPDSLYTRLNPVPVRAPHLAILNEALAKTLGLNIHSLPEQDAALLFAGNALPDGAQPIAQAYAGHQFGNFTILGDGRAILLGEHITPTNERFDIQLKGSGQTPFSRQGDGRAAIAPMLREYIISEAMHALNIPTTRSLAVVTTGESVMRERALPGAILTRVAASHIRVGTFEYLARTGNIEGIKILVDHVIQRHYPDLSETDNPYLALLNRTIDRQASLVAKWLLVGFIHGVMNTDNMTISGETIDYGPCAFMDTYDPNTVFSSIDHYGRYRYGKQPDAAQWNLARFAETLLPLLHPTQEQAVAIAEKAIHAFPEIFQNYWLAGMRKKLGLFTEETKDSQLFEILLTWMQGHQVDYTHTFHSLASASIPNDVQFNDSAFIEWHARWQARLLRQPDSKTSAINLMLANNPAIIPRNHRVEEALAAASEQGDYTRVHQLHAAVTNPYADIPEHYVYRTPPPPSDRVYQTFCGT